LTGLGFGPSFRRGMRSRLISTVPSHWAKVHDSQLTTTGGAGIPSDALRITPRPVVPIGMAGP
jgi:hypothetical protein